MQSIIKQGLLSEQDIQKMRRGYGTVLIQQVEEGVGLGSWWLNDRLYW